MSLKEDYEAIVDAAEEALSRERYALEAMKRCGVTREGLGLAQEPAVCGTLEDIIEAARGRNFDAVMSLIGDIDIPQVKEKLLQLLDEVEFKPCTQGGVEDNLC